MCSCFCFFQCYVEMLKISLFIRVPVLFLECYILLGVVAWVEAGAGLMKYDKQLIHSS
jgi:hypothetical protein